jgi:DNA-binding NtrC family response regulator
MGPVKNVSVMMKVLPLSPLEDDHVSLQTIGDHAMWILFKADHLAAALSVLRRHEISVIFCEHDLMPGSWTDLPEHIKGLRHLRSVIVTSRLANERLWTEALNLGAWDVLAKPFDRSEVLRSAEAAWRHWHNQIEVTSVAPRIMKAAR